MEEDMEESLDLPEHCGVDFDPTCATLDFGEEEYEWRGECEAGDDDCLNQLRRKTGTNRKSGRASMVKKEVDENALKEEPPEPIPLEFYKIKHKPNYPDDLKMKVVCALPTKNKKAAGAFKTHPKAVFTPSDPSLTTLQKRWMEERKKGPATGKQPSPPTPAIFNEPSILLQNRVPPPILSAADEIVVDWLEEHNIQMMFEYFLSLCVINQPDDPWIFICELCDKMIAARRDIGAFDQLPRVLSPEHTEAIFRIYDRMGSGYMTTTQYKAAMEAMGLVRFSIVPTGWEQDQINKETFVKEATDAINGLLRSFMCLDGEDCIYEEEEDEGEEDEEECDDEEDEGCEGEYNEWGGEYGEWRGEGFEEGERGDYGEEEEGEGEGEGNDLEPPPLVTPQNSGQLKTGNQGN